MGKQVFDKETRIALDITNEDDREAIRKTLQANVFAVDYNHRMPEPCWEWSVTQKVTIGHRDYLPHQLSYEVFKGTRPEGKNIKRVCGNPKCIRPEHLIVTWGSADQETVAQVVEAECERLMYRLERRCRIPRDTIAPLVRVFSKKLTQRMGIPPEE